MLGTFLLILLIVLVVGSLPIYRHSAAWGYYPSGIGFILLLILLLWMFGVIGGGHHIRLTL